MPPSAHGLDVASEGPSTALALHKARLLGEIGQTAYHLLLTQRFKMKVCLSSWLLEVKCRSTALNMKCMVKPLARPLDQIKFDINNSPRKGLLR